MKHLSATHYLDPETLIKSNIFLITLPADYIYYKHSFIEPNQLTQFCLNWKNDKIKIKLFMF